MCRNISDSLAPVRAFSGALGWVNNRKLIEGVAPELCDNVLQEACDGP
jgi:hypothetical protein